MMAAKRMFFIVAMLAIALQGFAGVYLFKTPADATAYKIADGAQSEDARLLESAPATPQVGWPNTGKLLVKGASSSAGDYVSLIRFDIADMNSLPDENVLVYAKLRVYSYYIDSSGGVAAKSPLKVYPCLKPWDPDTATWNEYATGLSWEVSGARGVSDRGDALAEYIVTPGRTLTGWKEFDVTPLIQEWLQNPDAALNNGFVIDYDPDNGNLVAFSGTHATGEQGGNETRPELLIFWAPEQYAQFTIKNSGNNAAYIDEGSSSEDLYLYENEPTTNQDIWPRNTSLIAGDYFQDEFTGDRVGLIRFDIDSNPAPENSVVASAKLRLYQNYVNGGPVSYNYLSVYQCLKPWDISEANWMEYAVGQSWDSPGARGVSDRGKELSNVCFVMDGLNDSGLGWYEWDVTEAAAEWYSGEENNGLLLDFYPKNYGNKTQFSASNAQPGYGGEREWRPELVVNFVEAPMTCDDLAAPSLAQDLNNDCQVDSEDLAIFASKWLVCNDPDPANCQ